MFKIWDRVKYPNWNVIYTITEIYEEYDYINGNHYIYKWKYRWKIYPLLKHVVLVEEYIEEPILDTSPGILIWFINDEHRKNILKYLAEHTDYKWFWWDPLNSGFDPEWFKSLHLSDNWLTVWYTFDYNDWRDISNILLPKEETMNQYKINDLVMYKNNLYWIIDICRDAVKLPSIWYVNKNEVMTASNKDINNYINLNTKNNTMSMLQTIDKKKIESFISKKKNQKMITEWLNFYEESSSKLESIRNKIDKLSTLLNKKERAFKIALDNNDIELVQDLIDDTKESMEFMDRFLSNDVKGLVKLKRSDIVSLEEEFNK